MQMWNLNTYILETFVFAQRQPHHTHRGDMKMTSDCFVFSPNIGKNECLHPKMSYFFFEYEN